MANDIQKLRCHAFYEALRFAPQIEALGKVTHLLFFSCFNFFIIYCIVFYYKNTAFEFLWVLILQLLVERMRSYGPYIALHLRFEKDMLAFSGCTYGLSSGEADELTRIRQETFIAGLIKH